MTVLGYMLEIGFAVALYLILRRRARKFAERHSNVVPFRKRAGWGFVDYRGCASRRR